MKNLWVNRFWISILCGMRSSVQVKKMRVSFLSGQNVELQENTACPPDQRLEIDRIPEISEEKEISKFLLQRHQSYLKFDIAAWSSTSTVKFPSHTATTLDPPGGPILTPPGIRGLKEETEDNKFPVDWNLLERRCLTDSCIDRNIFSSSMFHKTYNVKIPMVPILKDTSYKHLQNSSSVESNDVPNFEPASGSRGNLLTANRSNLSDDRVPSNLTVMTTISAQSPMLSAKKGKIETLELSNTTQISQKTRHSSNEEDDNEEHQEDLPYHPHSPRHHPNKPMTYEGTPSRTESPRLLRVPPVPAALSEMTLAQNGIKKETKEDNRAGCSRPASSPHSKKYADDTRANSAHLNSKSIDFVLVYEHGQSESHDLQRRYFQKNLRHAGLILETDSTESDEHSKLRFIRIHSPWDTLCRTAEMLQMKMPLRSVERPDNDRLVTVNDSTLMATIKEFIFSNWFGFNDTERILIGQASNHVTAQFTRARLEEFLITDQDSFFTPTQRIRIVYEIMQKARCDPDDSKKRGVQWLLKNGIYAAAYPPHDGDAETRHLSTNEPSAWSQRQILRHTWANFGRLFQPQPLHLIRAYFGEKIGFYFAWLGFYTQMLIFPSIIGVICFLSGVFSLSSNPLVLEICSDSDDPAGPHDVAHVVMCPVCRLPNCQPWILSSGCESARWNYRFDNESHVVMAIFTLLWATVFVELWKRREAELASEWDAYDAEQTDEPMRPEYEARTKTVRISPVTNEEEPYVPAYRRAVCVSLSIMGVFLLILCVVLALMGLIAVRIALYGILSEWEGFWANYKFEIASLIIHVFTFVIVLTLGSIYEPTAHRLTELECPRTQADYLSSYTWKVFIFELLNNFVPILYAATIRGRVSLPHQQDWLTEMCDPGGCLNEVVQAVAVLLLARLLISNAAELGVPFLKSVLKSKFLGRSTVHPDHESGPSSNHIPRWRQDFALNGPDLDGVYAEYLEMMVQFGYVTLFIAAFPLAPLICLLNNIVEVRIDATNFVTSFRRPLPARVSGIRIWRTCLNVILKLSVLCNGAFLAFTSELVPTLMYRMLKSDDGSTNGYVRWSMSQMNTTDWTEYSEYAPNNSTVCYYRDFRDNDGNRTLIWWQVMVARLTFFVVFVITFYFIQWLCDFLFAEVPKYVKLKIDRANFVARQALYGQETSTGNGEVRSRIHSSLHRNFASADIRKRMETDQRKVKSLTNGISKLKPTLDSTDHLMHSGNGHVHGFVMAESHWHSQSLQLHPNQPLSPISPVPSPVRLQNGIKLPTGTSPV